MLPLLKAWRTIEPHFSLHCEFKVAEVARTNTGLAGIEVCSIINL